MSSRKSDRSKHKEPGPQAINSLVSLFTQAHYPEAESVARSMTINFPQHGFAWSVLGAVLELMGRNIDALAAMKKAAILSPNLVEVHYNLGNISGGIMRERNL